MRARVGIAQQGKGLRYLCVHLLLPMARLNPILRYTAEHASRNVVFHGIFACVAARGIVCLRATTDGSLDTSLVSTRTQRNSAKNEKLRLSCRGGVWKSHPYNLSA